MSATVFETDNETTVVLVGSARVSDAQELKEALGRALASGKPLVTLDLTAVDQSDVTLYQLALVLQKALSDQGRHLLLKTLPPDHPVVTMALLVGIPLGHHFTQLEARP